VNITVAVVLGFFLGALFTGWLRARRYQKIFSSLAKINYKEK